MTWIKKIKNFFRDKSRDNLYKHLKTLGLDVSFAERGIPEEKLFNPWHRRSLGVININSDYLISYINIIKRDRGKDTPPRWWYYFAIPSKTSKDKKNYIEVKSKKNKSFFGIGKEKSFEWLSNNKGEYLAQKFTNDTEINSLLRLGNLRVQSLHEKFSGYSIELEFIGKAIKNNTLNMNHWNALNKIAKLIIENKSN